MKKTKILSTIFTFGVVLNNNICLATTEGKLSIEEKGIDKIFFLLIGLALLGLVLFLGYKIDDSSENKHKEKKSKTSRPVKTREPKVKNTREKIEYQSNKEDNSYDTIEGMLYSVEANESYNNISKLEDSDKFEEEFDEEAGEEEESLFFRNSVTSIEEPTSNDSFDSTMVFNDADINRIKNNDSIASLEEYVEEEEYISDEDKSFKLEETEEFEEEEASEDFSFTSNEDNFSFTTEEEVEEIEEIEDDLEYESLEEEENNYISEPEEKWEEPDEEEFAGFTTLSTFKTNKPKKEKEEKEEEILNDTEPDDLKNSFLEELSRNLGNVETEESNVTKAKRTRKPKEEVEKKETKKRTTKKETDAVKEASTKKAKSTKKDTTEKKTAKSKTASATSKTTSKKETTAKPKAKKTEEKSSKTTKTTKRTTKK